MVQLDPLNAAEGLEILDLDMVQQPHRTFNGSNRSRRRCLP
jgi:hypothetical protein